MLVLRQNSSDRHGCRRPADRHGSTGQERKAPSAPQQSCAKHSEQDGQDHPSGDQTDDPESQARHKLNADPDPEERHAETQNSLRAHGDPRHATTFLCKEMEGNTEQQRCAPNATVPSPARRGGVQLGQQQPLRAALYCRVSTADQSCARQERDLAAFANRSGYEMVGTYKETASGVKLDRAERKRVIALAQRREIDVVLVTELSRWGRSTTDLLATLKELETRRVSLIALNGMTFDLTTPHGRMMATLLAGIAEFERELIQERIRSGIAAAKARGKKLGRQPGQRPKSDRLAPRVLALVAQGRSYRLIGREVGLSKNPGAGIVKRPRAALVGS